jgi:DNA-binding NarL/FixJ family response regulator
MQKTALAKVMIVDDDPFIRVAISSTLKSVGFDVVGSFDSAKDAVASYLENPSELVLLDLDLGIGPNGIDLAHSLRKLNESVGIVLLTTFVDPRFADARNLKPPKGSRYLVKSDISDISQLITVLLQTKHRPFVENINHVDRFASLTDIQIEVWKMVADGLSSSEIAERRDISEKAVEAIIARIYNFLDLKKVKENNPRVLLANYFKILSGKI